MSHIRAALLGSLCAMTIVTSPAGSAPPKRPKPAPVRAIAPGMQLRFVKLQGVNPKTGVLSRKGTITEYKLRVVQETIYVVVMGVARPKTVRRQVPVAVSRTIETTTHNAYYGNGKLIPAEDLFEEIRDGQVVLISSTPKIPRAFLNLLSPDAVIIAPKSEAPKGKATRK